MYFPPGGNIPVPYGTEHHIPIAIEIGNVARETSNRIRFGRSEPSSSVGFLHALQSFNFLRTNLRSAITRLTQDKKELAIDSPNLTSKKLRMLQDE